MEYRFKTQAIFTVEANSEREALQKLMDATGERLVPIKLYVSDDALLSDTIRYNTMRAFERVGVVDWLLNDASKAPKSKKGGL